jgi:hypothetical protein
MLAAGATALIGLTAVCADRRPAGIDREMILTTGYANGYGPWGFDVTANAVKGLYPGASKRIGLTLRNPGRAPIQVYEVKGKLISTSKRGCTASQTNLEVKAYDGHLPITVLPWSRQSAGYLSLHMPNTVAEACQRASFIIRITGHATKAGR